MDIAINNASHYSLATKILNISSSDLKEIESLLSPPENDNCVIIDLCQLTEKQTVLWFRKVRTLLKQYRYLLIGVCNAGINLEHAKAASINSLDSIFNPETTDDVEEQTTEQPKPHATQEYCPPIVYTSNIRSGQRIHHEQDIVIIGNVNPGSEVISSGNIHVYGLLAGRALAGVNNNNDARIFSATLAAELVAINGHYHSSEEMTTSRKNSCISLVDEKLTYTQI